MRGWFYLLYRRSKAWLYSAVFFACRLFPIKKNRICACAFEGRGGFCCNPKYLVKELHRRNPFYEFIWLVNDTEKEFPDYIRAVPNTMIRRAFYLSTAAVWIDNYRNPYGTKKRKGQYYLNVNHYTIALKSTGLWRGKGFSRMAYLVSRADSDMMDALVTDSVWCDAVLPKGMLFEGTYLRTGAPRCDVLYGERTEWRHRFRERHRLPADAKVCMYAPTFREGAKDGKRFVYEAEWGIDFSRLLRVLAERFGGTWYLCLRVHPQLAASHRAYENREELKGRVLDESFADDMYEILAGMDAFVTDYSSAVFEAGFCRMPAFLFMEDLDTYTRDRGSLLWTFPGDPTLPVRNNRIMTPALDVTLPFPVARDQHGLEDAVRGFDAGGYERKLAVFHEAIGLVFDGKASGRAADAVERAVRGREQEGSG